MKRLTVDLVVTGDEGAALDTAADAVRQGQRVLVVLPTGTASGAARFRRICGAAAGGIDLAANLTVITNAEVVCVDGVRAVEAVLIRHRRTGRVDGVNASAFRCCDVRERSGPPAA